ncbi:helix-turn-helix domain-containing protein [Nocardioides pocheonensis]|uniref:DNA-binding protein n=1 Tax=Nocardioides pocheonensis TaxID=661485 RepID=A0A3N0GLE2_9ACTN|nr:helix-turn-helix domain-containing protein [Nocardioides pocheonensis]RNM13295.1 DNA-binding protein [Nocardioides pocheonensis]
MVAQALPNTRRRLGKISDGAAILDCDPKTVRRYIAQGLLTGYRVGPRNLRVDLDEVDALARPIPTATAS